MCIKEKISCEIFHTYKVITRILLFSLWHSRIDEVGKRIMVAPQTEPYMHHNTYYRPSVRNSKHAIVNFILSFRVFLIGIGRAKRIADYTYTRTVKIRYLDFRLAIFRSYIFNTSTLEFSSFMRIVMVSEVLRIIKFNIG